MLIPGNVAEWCYQLNWKAEYKDCVLTAVCCVCHSEWHPPVPPAGAECVWDSPGWGHCSSGPDPAQPDRGRCCRWQGQHGDRRRLPGEAQGPARWGKGLLICSAVLALLSRKSFMMLEQLSFVACCLQRKFQQFLFQNFLGSHQSGKLAVAASSSGVH